MNEGERQYYNRMMNTLLKGYGDLIENMALRSEVIKDIVECIQFLTYEVVSQKTIELADRKRMTSSQRYVNKKMMELEDSFKGLLKWWQENQPKGKWNEPYKYQ